MLKLFTVARIQASRTRALISLEGSRALDSLVRSMPGAAAGNQWGSLFLQPQVAHAHAGLSQDTAPSSSGIDLMDLFDGFLHMGVPKSKVSPSRKRMKHGKFVPDRIEWMTCEKCGEPKRPHRICTDHIEVCALTPEQWEEKKKRVGGAGSAPVVAAQSAEGK